MWRVLQSFGAEALEAPGRLKYRLAPIVATSAAEQEQLYALFDQYLADIRQYRPPAPAPPPPRWWQRWPVAASVALLLGVLAFWWGWRKPPEKILHVEHPAEVTVGESFTAANRSAGYDTTQARFRWELRDAGSGRVEQRRSGPADWTLRIDTVRGGNDKTLYLLAATERQVDTFRSSLRLRCVRPPLDTIDAPSTASVGAGVRFRLRQEQQPGYSYAWDFGDGTTSRAYAPVHAYRRTGGYQARLTITDTAAAGYCVQQLTHPISVQDTTEQYVFLGFQPLVSDRPPLVAYFTTGAWLLLLGLLLPAAFFWLRWLRQPPPVPDPASGAQSLEARFAHADRPPYQIPFRPQDEVLRPGPEMYRLAQVLRRRQEGLRQALDVPATIDATIGRGGFPSVQYRRTTVPANYLFLIDEQAPHSHQAQLYRYLYDFLRGQDVAVEALWYRQTPDRFWNASHPRGLTLEQVQRRYPHYRLLLLGDAHTLIDPLATEQHRVVPDLAATYRRWDSRLLLTPLPAPEWTYREAALYDLLAVFPSDTAGVQAAMDYLETTPTEEDERARPGFGSWRAARTALPPPPSAQYRRWKRPEAYDAYFDGRPELYRWFRALLVYPAPSWPLTLAIGQAIGAPVTFDNLLLLARLPYLQGQAMPLRLRQHLLSGLDRDTERRARAALAEELRAAAPAVRGGHANQPLQTQLALQEFLLAPETEEARGALLHLLDSGALTRRQVAEVEGALERQVGGPVQLEKFLAEHDAAAPKPAQRRLNADFYRAVGSTVLPLLLALTMGALDGSATLLRWWEQLQPPQEPDPTRPAGDFWVSATYRPDSAVYYNNRAVAAWDSLRRQERPLLPEDLQPLARNLERALALRQGDYALAADNAARNAYHRGLLHYHDYLQNQEDQQLAVAEPFFRKALGAAVSAPDARHALGLLGYYQDNRLMARNVYDTLLAAGYFDTLSLQPNLRTLLFPNEGAAVQSDCLPPPAVTPLSPDTLCAGDSLRLRFRAPPPAVDYYLVRWGDGQADTVRRAATLAHAYARASGRVGVRVLAFGRCAEEGPAYRPQTLAFFLLYPPRIYELAPSTQRGCPPLTVGYNALVAAGQTYRWDLGNGQTSTEPRPTATYTEPGTYTVRLLVRNACGQDSLALTGAVTVQGPVACAGTVTWRGQVLDAKTGQPIAGAKLSLNAGDQGGATLETDPEGLFTTNAFLPGTTVAINLIAAGYPDTTYQAAVSADPLTLRVPPLPAETPPTPQEETPPTPIPQPEMVTVPGGTFTMGCASEARDGDCEDDEKPAHEVTVDAFYMSVHEVTVGQFMAFIEDSGYRTDTDKEGWSYIWTGSSYEKKDGVNWKCDVSGDIRPQVEYRHPVIHVSWNDAVAYAEWLSQKTGQNYRLPTEAEWEYAARGGERGAKDNHLYSGSNTIDEVAWYDGNSGGQTHPVGQKKANQLGLYDMSGNVWEWCADWYGEYPAAAQRNPTGPGRGSDRVLRGGGWISSPQYCRAANRDNGNPDARSGYVGFRVVSSQ